MQSLFGVMEEHNYTLQSLSYTNPSQVEEDTSFIAVFALSINAMASYMGHFDLNASQVEEMLFTSTEANISKIKIFMGYQKDGRHMYLIVHTSEVNNFVAVMGQTQKDAVSFKALMANVGYTRKQQAVDTVTKHVITYSRPSSLLRGVLYVISNIHNSSSLKGIVHQSQRAIVHISTYQPRPGETRFIAVFDSTKQKGRDQILLVGTDLDSQLDKYASQGYLPTLITPYFLRQKTNYFSLVINQNQ